jgi:hypothetical protein
MMAGGVAASGAISDALQGSADNQGSGYQGVAEVRGLDNKVGG